jgi:hypothetical protein
VPHSNYLPERMGTAAISPTGKFEAGSFQSFTLVYTAGYFGIDDTGSIKIVHPHHRIAPPPGAHPGGVPRQLGAGQRSNFFLSEKGLADRCDG